MPCKTEKKTGGMSLRRSESDVDLEALAKDELLRLQRQYRLMEGDRKAFAEESGTKVGRQRRMLGFLQAEKEDLLTDLKNALSPQNQALDKETIRTILAILDKYTQFQGEIVYQLGQIAEMEEQVDKITQRVVQQKLKVQALFGQSMTVAQAEKRRRVLEDRLYHATTLFDTQTSNNQQVIKEINLNLMERGRFYNRYESNKQKLARMKRQMAIIVDNATSTYDAREEATAKIHAHRERNDKESKQHVLDMKEYQRILHHDEKAHAFMVAKSRVRGLIEEEADRQKRLDFTKEKQLDDVLQSYKNSFRDLLALANTHDVETLVQKYLAQEQANFARFKYIAGLNDEVESIYEAIKELKIQIEEKSRMQQTENKSQRRALRKLEKEYTKAIQHLEDLQNEWKDAEANMEVIVGLVEEVFNLADCANAPIIQLLGNRSGIQPRNVALCLGVLEHRITELQHSKAMLDIRKNVELEGGQLPVRVGGAQGPRGKPNGGPFKPKVIITGRIDAGGEDEEEIADNEPQDFRELRNQIVTKMRQFAVGSNHNHEVSGHVPGNGMSSQISIAPPQKEERPPQLSIVEQRLARDADQRQAAMSLVDAPPPPPPAPATADPSESGSTRGDPPRPSETE